MDTLSTIELLCVAVAINNRKKQKKTNVKAYWIHPFNNKRLQEGVFYKLYPKIRDFPDKFFEYYRMSVNSFDELKCLIRDRLQKQTFLREPIGVEERMTVTLSYLATGTNFTAMSHNFRIAKQTIRIIVEETCDILWDILQPQEMHPPSDEEWQNISLQFLKKTQFPNCLGAVDGKHIRLRSPMNSGSSFYNYKQYNSIVLLAIVDAQYKFIAIDVGAYGREGDSTIFKESTFGKKLYQGTLNIPQPQRFPNTSEDSELMPFVCVGDEAFGLHKNILRPYPRRNLSMQQRIFNYRLSRARRYVECAFGILTNKWRVFHTPILLQPDFAVKVTRAACVLHNFVRVRDGYQYEDTLSYSFGEGDADDVDYGRNSVPQNAMMIRDKFSSYFLTPSGEISWQYCSSHL